MNEVDIAWCAGLFEGEGCLSTIRHHRSVAGVEYEYDSFVLVLTSTDLDIVERFCKILGGKIYTVKLKPGHKQAWTWRVARQSEILRIIELLRPQMGNRRGMKMDEVWLQIKSKEANKVEEHEQSILRKREYNRDRYHALKAKS